jgi:hypothetical protein
MPLLAAYQATAPVERRQPRQSGRSDISLGRRVFHSKFGYGEVAEIAADRATRATRTIAVAEVAFE